ncbi:(d)CMP kinase [Lactovum miscens]|uniref:Cytidylate kinase n=1 Tax=Lactovum miscens TaxID=190387 RepID=A0A841CAJ3_9LACT|nr:(d)CMP kinase [Lactovum miscens]MBB5888738.1 cytidylate kinase [Lactovum miscens]
MKKNIQIAIDGPASSGKSTVAKIIANDLAIIYLDTGAMYRSATLVSIEEQTKNSIEIIDYLKDNPISFEKTSVFIGNRDVTEVIRDNEVTSNVSEISAIPEIRKFMVSEQRRIAGSSSIIMDGRDIATVVLPNADLKIFLIADVEERAQRRYKENIKRGIESDLGYLIEEIATRDKYDSTREVSPLKPAEDSIIFDTTGKSIEEVVAFIENKAKELK